MSSPALSYKDHYTYQDYLSWEDGERWELIDGVAYNMTPAPIRKHQRLVHELSRIIGNALVGKSCEVNIATFDVRLPKAQQSEDEVDTVVQPDLSVICDPSKLDEKGGIGAPDWIIEVLSPSTATKDLNLKAILYQTHGVREYWIVDPEKEQIIVNRLDEDRKQYTFSRVYERSNVLASVVLPELPISLEEVFKAAE
ncbi:MAG TPA: Uma2 family endonuclease [Cytophagales bacterium]|nr:Uma2 family endonuclease [Cytophagales bacterium]HAA20686.1 Uma2 family endonuclease [Cytophagales bacterium]HAP65140.1 Uma2 family endonuclease [Cytophagales bacterium]